MPRHADVRSGPVPRRRRRTFDGLRERGVKVMLWVSPYRLAARRLPGSRLSRRDAAPGRRARVVDRSDERPPPRRSGASRLRAALALGIDGLKGDRGDEIDHEPRLVRRRARHGRAQPLPGRVRARVVRGAAATRARDRDDLPCRDPGVDPEPERRLGGRPARDLTGLRTAIRMAQTAGVSGFPIWGSDIGGYHSENLTREVFVRWAQFAAVTPIFEVGGIGQNARFWTFGPATVELFRRAAELHYELFPHLYELARRAARTGLPIIRPLGTGRSPRTSAPGRPTSSSSSGTICSWRRLRPRQGTRTASTYPQGEWVDLARGTRHRGGRHDPPSDAARRAAALPPCGHRRSLQYPDSGDLVRPPGGSTTCAGRDEPVGCLRPGRAARARRARTRARSARAEQRRRPRALAARCTS